MSKLTDPKTGLPFGEHGRAQDAIDYALSNYLDLHKIPLFLHSWQHGHSADEWPEYYDWLKRGI